jgi:hypothetical protein
LLWSQEEHDDGPQKRTLQRHAWGFISSRHPIRKACIIAVSSVVFERVSAVVIVLNCIFLALEDPLDGDDETLRNQLLARTEPVFTALFTVELLLKVRPLMHHCCA